MSTTSTAGEGQCATIGFGIESKGTTGAESTLRRTDYAGIATCSLFDLAHDRWIVRVQSQLTVA
jgi:hypothetical protein